MPTCPTAWAPSWAVLDRLAAAGISISNLTVMNSREGAGGALRIELKDEPSYRKAKEILG